MLHQYVKADILLIVYFLLIIDIFSTIILIVSNSRIACSDNVLIHWYSLPKIRFEVDQNPSKAVLS